MPNPTTDTKTHGSQGCSTRWLSGEAGMLLALAINKAIARDPVAQRKLSQLQGSSLLLRLTVPALQLGVRIDADGVELVDPEQITQPDCEIEGAPSDLLGLLLDPQQAFENRVQLRGNSALANQLRAIALELDLDWGGLLGDRIGDLGAQLLLNVLRRGRSSLAEGSQNLLDDLDNWLHEEIQVQPCAAELDHFYEQVDRLKLDADRLRARLERLEQRAKTEASSE